MGRDIIDIIKEKEFHQLTSMERDELQDFCSNEEEFQQMKSVFLSVDSLSAETLKPSEKTKERLDDLFVATYPKATPVWYNSVLAVVIPKDKPIYRQPLFQMAAACMLLFFLFYMPSVNLTEPSTKLAQNEKVDQEPVMTETPSVVDVPKTTDSKLAEADGEMNVQQPVLLEDQTRTVTFFDRAEAESISMDELSNASGSGSFAPAPTSSHPDGIFIGATNIEKSESLSAAESADLLDLLTATF